MQKPASPAVVVILAEARIQARLMPCLVT